MPTKVSLFGPVAIGQLAPTFVKLGVEGAEPPPRGLGVK